MTDASADPAFEPLPVALTHTPNPRGFLAEMLERPVNR
jgi:hypothetical protein